MSDTLNINNSVVDLVKGDYTDMEIESIVYYAQNDLKLGSGFGNAISMRGGPSIQDELNKFGEAETTDVVVTAGGELKTRHILHAVGPKFQEEYLSDKLKKTIHNCLKKAEEKGIKTIAFPPMGCGFYGVALEVSADIMFKTFEEYLSGDTSIEKIVICLNDNREFIPFHERLNKNS